MIFISASAENALFDNINNNSRPADNSKDSQSVAIGSKSERLSVALFRQRQLNLEAGVGNGA